MRAAPPHLPQAPHPKPAALATPAPSPRCKHRAQEITHRQPRRGRRCPPRTHGHFQLLPQQLLPHPRPHGADPRPPPAQPGGHRPRGRGRPFPGVLPGTPAAGAGHRGVPGEAPGGSAPTRGPGPALTPRRPRAAPPAHGRRSGAGGPGGGGVPLAPPPLLSGLITSPISKPGPGCECGAPAAGRAGGRWVSPPRTCRGTGSGSGSRALAPLREPRLRSFPAKPLSPAENRSVNPRPPNGSRSDTGTFRQRVSRVRGDNLRPPTPAQPLPGTRVPASAVPVLLTHKAAGGCSCTRSFGGRACSGGPEPPSALALVQMRRPGLPNRAGHC